MIIQKGAQVWYWPTARSPAPLNATLGASVPAVIARVASAGAGNVFAAVKGATLDLNIAGARATLRAVPLVTGVPTPEHLASSGFCTTRPYIPPPLPLTFDQAVVQVRMGKTAARAGVRITPADVAAADWSAA